ncbi:NIPSNAP family protein [Paenibacillus glycinis]|uniref:NIPSNAP family protein n=1 Tax=Paenibacillus glycinis TaxID=2697035 RepID=A0ABW9XM96_9BACL|nr:NIPSNAP family protein [Paenibacillus glycinis]NBD23724.1 NIPSNAP family protein [Paenibacillus glycinis]
MLYELRMYDIVPGRMPAILDRFRDDTIKLFAKHDMKVTQFWIDADEASNRLYYLVEHADMDARNLNYERFRADPEWLEVRRVSEQDGPLVDKQESVFMKNAPFFQRQ